MADLEKKIDFNALGQSLDSTWGRSSTPTGASQSVKFVIKGTNLLEVRYTAIVNLVNDQEMVDLKKKYTNEAEQVCSIALKKVKETYKELSEKTLKLKQVSDDAKFEIIDLNIYNRKRTAYFRKNVVYEMS